MSGGSSSADGLSPSEAEPRRRLRRRLRGPLPPSPWSSSSSPSALASSPVAPAAEPVSASVLSSAPSASSEPSPDPLPRLRERLRPPRRRRRRPLWPPSSPSSESSSEPARSSAPESPVAAVPAPGEATSLSMENDGSDAGAGAGSPSSAVFGVAGLPRAPCLGGAPSASGLVRLVRRRGGREPLLSSSLTAAPRWAEPEEPRRPPSAVAPGTAPAVAGTTPRAPTEPVARGRAGRPGGWKHPPGWPRRSPHPGLGHLTRHLVLCCSARSRASGQSPVKLPGARTPRGSCAPRGSTSCSTPWTEPAITAAAAPRFVT